MKDFTLTVQGLVLRFLFASDAPVTFTVDLAGAEPAPSGPETGWRPWARLVEVQASGFNPDIHHGNKYVGTSPGDLLRYESHRETEASNGGVLLEISQRSDDLRVLTHIRFIRGVSAFRIWNEVTAIGQEEVLLEYVGSLAITGLSREGEGRWAETMRLHVPDNTWGGECQWRAGRTGDFGLHQFYAEDGGGAGTARISFSNQGTWSSAGALPLGVIENTVSRCAHFWQIEHNGSWHWEISDIAGQLYLRASGPTWREGLWSKRLAPGRTFASVPVTYGLVAGDVQDAFRSLTQVRRASRRSHADLEKLPVIFNDYMNCLWADPSEEQLQPLIAKAAQAGCEYFVIDAGWYAEAGRSWWDTVGEWQPVASRFPSGLAQVIQTIRDRGMSPGLWLEIEVMGINCPLARSLPDDWFFLREGRRVIDHGRFQLDFRNPAVRLHADAVVDRLVAELKVGYLKMDYNINAGPGTDHLADSPGDGLLEHNRAYLEWIEGMLDRHPQLVIENCGAGGLRMDYAMLRLHPIQSITDQPDCRLNVLIAASAASAVAPEQAAVWSYPRRESDDEETIFNLVNSMLLRIHQSGRIMDLSARNHARVREGISVYKTIRHDIPRGLPFWPLGLPKPGDEWVAFGLDCGSYRYLAVWRLASRKRSCVLPLPARTQAPCVECLFPQGKAVPAAWDASQSALKVALPRPFTARLFRVEG